MKQPISVLSVRAVRQPPDRIDISVDGTTASIPGLINPITVTITADMPWGPVTIAASACGPHDLERAGWQAIKRLDAAEPGLIRERRELIGAVWWTTDSTWKDPTVADEPTPLRPPRTGARGSSTEELVAELTRRVEAEEVTDAQLAPLNAATLARAGRQLSKAWGDAKTALGLAFGGKAE